MKAKNKIIVTTTASALVLALIGYARLSNYETVKENIDHSIQLELVDDLKNNELVIKENIEDSTSLETEKSSDDTKESINKLPVYSLINSENSSKTVQNVLKGISKVKNPKNIYDINKVMKRKWVVDIGNMSYRSNFELIDGHIYVGSNGEYFNDWHTWDKKSGVYKINAKSGKLVKKFAGGKMGDMDVNGLLYYKDYLFFGNDNDEFLCTDLNGEIMWRIPVSGDVEHKPTLVKRKEDDVVVFATEVGEVRAVNPENGNTVWEYYHPEFNGWKKGDNRYVFKLTTHFKRGYIFFGEPRRNDYNRDGVIDLHWSGYNNYTVLSGQDGKLIKSLPKKIKTLNSGEIIKDNNHPIKLGIGESAKFISLDQKDYKGDKQLVVFNQNGSVHKNFNLSKPRLLKDDENWYASLGQINNTEALIVSSSIIYIYNLNDNSISEIVNFNKVIKKKYSYSDDYYNSYQLSGSKDYLKEKINTELGLCRLIKWEFGESFHSSPIIKLFKVSDNSEVLNLRLDSKNGEEGPLLIKDIDKDGKQELIVECDGKLVCYDFSSIKL